MPKTFLQENIMELLELEPLSDEQKIDLLEKMVDIVQKRVMIRIIEKLDDKQHLEFAKILDENDNEKALDFLTQKIEDFPAILEEEIMKFKKEILSEKEKWSEII